MSSPYVPNLTKQGLYDPQFERDACGVGLVASVKGARSHDIVTMGLEVLRNLGHRGACGADPETGDGAGVLMQMPHEFFAREAESLGFELPQAGDYGVGMVFLPPDDAQREQCEREIERVVAAEGLRLLGWRDVPVSPDAIGRMARAVMPAIRQFFVARPDGIAAGDAFALELYLARRRIENSVAREGLSDSGHFYISSMSDRQIVYKGLVMAHQLESFFHDLDDDLIKTAYVLVHSRFSTNTLGSWRLAHPFRYIIHNGEINTIRGNVNWMMAREGMFSSPEMGDRIDELFPIVSSDQSDTASFDNALELLLATGRSLPHALMMMIPEAWGDHIRMEQAKKDFYDYHSRIMEPWDGPALIIGADGARVCGVLDRNGLRPCRYLVTTDDILVMASETGVLDVPMEKVRFKDRIYPGRMFELDTEQGRIIEDQEVKAELSARRPYGEWMSNNSVDLASLPEPGLAPGPEFETLGARQKAFGYTLEDLSMIMLPMAENGAEPVGSMGNDAPLAVLSEKLPLLFDYFKQMFAQVSNPPLDAIREELVTSLETTLGSEQNLFDETAEHCRQLRLKGLLITNREMAQLKELDLPGLRSRTLEALFDVEGGSGALKQAMDRLCAEAARAIEEGCSILVISDRGADSRRAPIPSLLATAGVHHHLIRAGTRARVGIAVESGEPREISHFALLSGYGAGTINPYLALETLADLSRGDGFTEALDYETAEYNYFKAAHKGVLKVISKMGVSTLQGYRGAQIFEAVGLNEELIDRYFTWTPSRIGGVGLEQIEEECRQRHREAYGGHANGLPGGGRYQWRREGEYHMWNPDTIAKLQDAAQSNRYSSYREFAEFADGLSEKMCTIRGLLEFKTLDEPIDLDEVEPASEIVKRFATGAVSLGSISREAHETMAIAMNRIGARSNTGEGGEDYHRYTLDPNGDSRSSSMKQVASGRFGVTINYLANATDLQIKMAQGSKPGEGGQLPGHKVDEYIGWVRNSTPGVELISPPPHHDIYSIEDLAQLIYDLKNANPSSRVHVKLVSEAGVGTIAAGVSKGHGDVVLISGDSGGTGASPESSIKFAGLPWEVGLAETQQVLVLNDLRGRIVVQTDGQLKTGRDVAIACLLGAEEFGFATAPLITLGCIMLRKCHLNTCSVGIATQDPELRRMFNGKPEHLINYLFFIAEHMREIMAELGFRTVNEMVGRVDKLDSRKAVDHWKASGVDFSALLHRPDVPDEVATYCCQEQDHSLWKALDNDLIERFADAIENRRPQQLSMPIHNYNRTVGAMLSHEVAKRYGEEGLPDDMIRVSFTGSAGQSFSAFLAKGVTMTVDGDANDYFCKGLSGGKVVIKPPAGANFVPETTIVIGNVALYGATGGKAFIRGVAGERFAVRNSGAETVVEGVGDHGCEYMTRGKVVVLGPTGRNFAAGMSGGEAYVLDEDGDFASRCNPEMVGLESVEEEEDTRALRRLVEEHLELTGSANARRVLADWDGMLPKFIKVMPYDYKRVLAERARAVSA